MNRLIKILGVLVFLVTFLPSTQCIAVDYVYFTNPLGGTFYDCNNWTSIQWEPNDCNIPKIDFEAPDQPIIGGWYEGGTTKGHLIVDYNLYTGFSLGSNIMGHGQVDILPDANIQCRGLLTSSGIDSLAIVNMYGGVIQSPPTVPEFDPNLSAWSKLCRGGITYWNQYDGDVYLQIMNYWGDGPGCLYLNVSGGTFYAGYKPVPEKTKVYINVSGTGTVTIAGPWEEFLRPINPGGTWFTVNGGGTLILYNNWDGYDWVSDPTVNGTLSSDSNVTAEYLNGDTTWVKFTTDACGAIPDADLDKDCDVDFEDYASFADNW